MAYLLIDQLPLIMVCFWAIVVIFGGIYKSYRRRYRSIDIPNTSLLLSYYTDNVQTQAISKGTHHGMHFTAILATNSYGAKDRPDAALLYRVELPFFTTIHLVGIPKKTRAARLDPTRGKSIMERVTLEGNYNHHFDLFCEKGMQQTARYVLDPKAMVYTLDFCQSHNWEIVGSELYFVMSSEMKQHPDDPTLLSDDVAKFVAEIRPAVERPLNEQHKTILTPYGEDRRTDLKCPVCSAILENQGTYFSCPRKDGILLTGANLQRVKKGILNIPLPVAKPTHRDFDLTCPSCGEQMARVAYNLGPTQIDSCKNCTYRWLDTGEHGPS